MASAANPGSSVTITGANKLWIHPSHTHEIEYCYPGAFMDPDTQEITYSSVICIIPDDAIPTISLSQVTASIQWEVFEYHDQDGSL